MMLINLIFLLASSSFVYSWRSSHLASYQSYCEWPDQRLMKVNEKDSIIPFDDNSTDLLPESDTGLLGGIPGSISEFPFLVSLQRRINENEYKHLCGASILTDRWVLTAIHCVIDDINNLHIGDYLIRAGASEWNSRQGQEYWIDGAILNSKYKKENVEILNPDVALLHTDRPIEFGENVKNVCLPKTNRLPQVHSATIVGWGRMENDIFPDTLRKVHTQLSFRDECQRILRSPISSDVFCCGVLKQVSGCFGDSGGPAINKHKGRPFIYGVASYSFINEVSSQCTLSVYVDVSLYIDWIDYWIYKGFAGVDDDEEERKRSLSSYDAIVLKKKEANY